MGARYGKQVGDGLGPDSEATKNNQGSRDSQNLRNGAGFIQKGAHGDVFVLVFGK